MPIPLQSDLTDDSSAVDRLLPLLVNPSGRVEAPLLLPVAEMRKIAEHLVACGVRHVPELQTIWYYPPSDNASIYEASGGRWVEGPEMGVPPEGWPSAANPIDTAASVLAQLPDEAREALKAALEAGETK